MVVQTMKHCPKCNCDLPASSFHRSTQSPDGLYGWCKVCKHNRYKGYRKDPNTVRRMRENSLRYSHSGVNKTPEARAYYAAKMKEYRNRFPERARARTAVWKAVRRGKLPPALSEQCQKCGQQAHEYHHWSYAKKHWLHVIPLCEKCHDEIHQEVIHE